MDLDALREELAAEKRLRAALERELAELRAGGPAVSYTLTQVAELKAQGDQVVREFREIVASMKQIGATNGREAVSQSAGDCG